MELCDSKTTHHDLYYCGHVHSELTSFQLKPLLRNCLSVSVGWNFIYYVLNSDGSLLAIGWNRYGQCGQDPDSFPCLKHQLSRVPFFQTHEQYKVIDCVAGDHHSLVLDSLGDVYAFGSNAYGQLGRGKLDTTAKLGISSSLQCDFLPRKIHFEMEKNLQYLDEMAEETKVVQLEASSHQSFILLNSGEVFFCGWGGYFQLGSRTSDDYFAATRLNCDFLNSLKNNTNSDTNTSSSHQSDKIVRIASGSWHTLFLTNEGELYSVGWSKWGQLGLGMSDASVVKPSKINYFTERNIRIMNCASGSSHSLALDDNGVVYSFGRGKMGQLGQNDLEVLEFSDEPLVVSFTLNSKCAEIFARHWVSILTVGDAV